MKISRIGDVGRKAALYVLQILGRPMQAPMLLYYAARGVHLGEYLGLNQRFLQLPDIKTVIDVGANTGQFSSAASKVFRQARIYAFEPLNDCYESLIKRMSNTSKFQAWCLALGDQTGQIAFFRNEFSKSSSLLPMAEAHTEAFPWTAQSHEVTVDIDRLDNLRQEIVLERPALLKLDVQGSELSVLRGAVETLREIDIVITEVSFRRLYEGQPLFEDVYLFLRNNGFAYHGALESLSSPKDNATLQEDALFLRSA